jgi:hypothetical protein
MHKKIDFVAHHIADEKQKKILIILWNEKMGKGYLNINHN